MSLNIIAGVAAALTLAGGLLSTPTTSQAAAVLPGDSPVGTYKVDIDGDGHKDKVVTSRSYADEETVTWKIKVTTHKKKTSTVYVDSSSNADVPVLGFNSIDPVKGKEIEVIIWDDWGFGRMTEFKVLTWRHNKLVFEGAPRSGDFAASKSKEWWGLCDGDDTVRWGYYLFTSKRKHYVDFFQMSREGANRWDATFHRSVWKSGKWVNSGRRRDTWLDGKQAAKYLPATGIGD